MQHIGEGHLDIPDQWHNRSVNVYTASGPGVAGLSVTVNREQLPFETSLEEYVAQQSAKLTQQLKGYRLIERTELEIDARPAHQLEFTWQADDAGPIHQVLLCVANDTAVLNLAASHGGRMNDKQVVEVKRILHSLRFNPAGVADEAGASSPTPPSAAGHKN